MLCVFLPRIYFLRILSPGLGSSSTGPECGFPGGTVVHISPAAQSSSKVRFPSSWSHTALRGAEMQYHISFVLYIYIYTYNFNPCELEVFCTQFSENVTSSVYTMLSPRVLWGLSDLSVKRARNLSSLWIFTKSPNTTSRIWKLLRGEGKMKKNKKPLPWSGNVFWSPSRRNC